MYAEVAINAPVESAFHYHLPPELEGKLQPGHLVQVAFGTAQQHGIVLALHEHSPVEHTKPILARLDPMPVVTPQQIELARWISQTYLSPLGASLWLMLPPGVTGGRDIRVTLLQPDESRTDPVEQKVLDLLRRRGALTGRQLEAAKTLADQPWRPALEALTAAGLVEVERTITPPRARPKIVQTAALAIHPRQIPAVIRHLGRQSRRADILETLAAMRAEQPTIQEALQAADVATRSPLDKLAEAGLVVIDSQHRPATVSLGIPREDVPARLIELRRGETDLHILRVLARESEPVDVSWVYAQTGADLNDLKRLDEAGLVLLGEKPTWRDSLADRDFVPSVAPAMTPEQQAAWEPVKAAIQAWMWAIPPPGPLPASPAPQGLPLVASVGGDETAGSLTPLSVHGEGLGEGLKNQVFLVHGVTGSGKTEIYLRAIELTLAQGRQAIFLVPEIALTAQTVRRVAARFPGQVAVVHSALSEGERYDTWRRAREGLIGVVVGARSALFTPLPDVGLIILDEEHDDSYKQSPPVLPPYYHARTVAEEMVRLNNGVLILGSATPDLETVYRAQRGDITLLRLPQRIMGHRARILEQSERAGVMARYYPARAEDAVMIDLPPVQVVDMRQELKSGNTSIFSRSLQSALAETLKRREQAILFINRRGTSTYVFCRDCGYVATCRRCDTPLTYHRQGDALHCHHCGYQSPPPSICPQCGSKRIKYFGAGTQQVEQALVEQFPNVRILRWDADTATEPQLHEAYLQRFIEGKADLMVGTKMVTKGLDLPLVTLVGVVSADMGLNLPDFRACERTFQLLTQVAGRAGRGLLGGQVILQTYQPDHYVIQAAAKHDFEGFYQQEITFRRQMGYPPFRRLARIEFRNSSEVSARSDAERAAAFLRTRIEKLRLIGMELVGPAPCFFSRVNKIYRWQLLLRGPNPTTALEAMDFARGWYVDIDPVNVL